MKCTNCGANIDNDALFCDECGSKVESDANLSDFDDSSDNVVEDIPDQDDITLVVENLPKTIDSSLKSQKGKDSNEIKPRKKFPKVILITVLILLVTTASVFVFLFFFNKDKGDTGDLNVSEPSPKPSPESSPAPSPEPTPADGQSLDVIAVEVGNTPGNLLNGGIAAIQGDWIYFSDEYSLRRIKTDNSDEQKLTDDFFVYHINIIGDWVYYGVNHYDSNSIVYKIKSDGSDKQELALFNGWIESIYVIDDLIYLSESHFEYGTSVHKFKTDGSDRKELFRTNDYTGLRSFSVYEDWIYYFYENGPETVLQRFKTDSSEIQDIISLDSSFYWHMIIFEGLIYYSNNINSEIYRMNLDGTEDQLFLEVGALINIYNDWIYFNDTFGGIFRSKLNGTEFQQLEGNNTQVYYVNVVGDWIYYYTFLEDGYGGYSVLTRIKTDGSNREFIFAEGMGFDYDSLANQPPVDSFNPDPEPSPSPDPEPSLSPDPEPSPSPGVENTLQPQVTTPDFPSLPITIKDDNGLHIEIVSIRLSESDYDKRLDTWGAIFQLENLSNNGVVVYLHYTIHNTDGTRSHTNADTVYLEPNESKSTYGRVWGTRVEIDLDRSSFIVNVY